MTPKVSVYGFFFFLFFCFFPLTATKADGFALYFLGECNNVSGPLFTNYYYFFCYIDIVVEFQRVGGDAWLKGQTVSPSGRVFE